MSPEQKGRAGKKPKYQIADIGGSDLTTQDVSTERVLNFLIRGEHNPHEEAGPGANSLPDKGLENAPEETTEGRPEVAVPPAVTRPRKSLDHLFERASSVKSVEQARDLKPNPRPAGTPAPLLLPHAEPEVVVTERVEPEERVPEAVEHVTAPPSSGSLAPVVPPEASYAASTPADAVRATLFEDKLAEPLPAQASEQETNLERRAEAWKGFYRLKDGEIEALKALYLMSHAAGSAECYVKMRRLAEMSNLSYRYCQKVVRGLEQLGWITKLKDYDPDEPLGVLYRVNLNPSVTS